MPSASAIGLELGRHSTCRLGEVRFLRLETSHFNNLIIPTVSAAAPALPAIHPPIRLAELREVFFDSSDEAGSLGDEGFDADGDTEEVSEPKLSLAEARLVTDALVKMADEEFFPG